MISALDYGRKVILLSATLKRKTEGAIEMQCLQEMLDRNSSLLQIRSIAPSLALIEP